MSRARVHEVSSPISLFPFIGILLCTMGALLVILVAVSRSARSTAQREVQAQSITAAPAANDDVHKKLDEVKGYVGSLNAVRGQAERKLRDEQLRLSHVEDHIRRLQEKMRSLQSAAVELAAMEGEHYDDRQQAQREIDRLHQLIGDSQKTVESLREANGKESHSYAVVPYEGPNGTFRRPIYIECVKNELIVQPEGIRLTVDDLRPPIGPGNPLASVLRAGRDHLVRLNPQAGQSRETEPYPLLLVRPDGLLVYDRARQAIEAGDFDLGFELVESDWQLKFPQTDPQLAAVEEQALNQARARQEVLAAAAPRAYHNSSMAVVGEFDEDDSGQSGGDGSGGGGSGGSGPGGGRGGGGAHEYVVRSNRHVGGGESSGGATGDSSGAGGASDDGNSSELAESGSGGSASRGRTTNGAGAGDPTSAAQAGDAGDGDAGGATTGTAGAGGLVGSGNGNGAAPGGSAPDKNLVPDGYETQQNVAVVAGSSASSNSTQPDPGVASRSEKERMSRVETRGKDWALPQKPARSVPVRRTIHVTVRDDQLAILPDSAPATTAGGKTIPVRGDTVESLDAFVKQVRDQIDGWGMAGNGLYWRPVILLNVGPDGERRANDLARLLKNSGLEVRTNETARNLPQGSPHETR